MHPKPFDSSDRGLVDFEGQQFAPLERIVLPPSLDGSLGLNRATNFSLVRANNDLEAINAYLDRFEFGGSTFRKYRKELERYLLWCVLVTGKPMSSQFVEDCEAYKKFLIFPRKDFTGPRKHRTSADWRPFPEQPLKDSSRRAAVQCIRSYFGWLVKVGYIRGNSWIAVSDPETVTPLNVIQIEKALPFRLWEKLIIVAQKLAKLKENTQGRIELAAVLLMGDSGLRRSEVATVTSDQLKPSTFSNEVWELNVLGKRRKWRTVPVSQRTYDALLAHWNDRHPDIKMDLLSAPLLSPIAKLKTAAFKEKHHHDEEMPYASESMTALIESMIKKVINTGEFEPAEETILLRVSPHAFRHTFGTQSVANGLPVFVAQKILGHVSIATTSIYAHPGKEITMNEAEKYYKKLS